MTTSIFRNGTIFSRLFRKVDVLKFRLYTLTLAIQQAHIHSPALYRCLSVEAHCALIAMDEKVDSPLATGHEQAERTIKDPIHDRSMVFSFPLCGNSTDAFLKKSRSHLISGASLTREYAVILADDATYISIPALSFRGCGQLNSLVFRTMSGQEPLTTGSSTV